MECVVHVVKLNVFSHEETKVHLLLISSEAAFCDGVTGSSASEEGVMGMWQSASGVSVLGRCQPEKHPEFV